MYDLSLSVTHSLSLSMRILIIGTGSIGERHLRVFQNLGRCSDIAFCEPHQPRRAEIASRYNIADAAAFADLDAALASATFDGAIVATPAPSHIAIGLRLAGLGIHHLVEKPLSLTLDGVDEYARAVDKAGVLVAVGYVHRAHPAVAAIRQQIASGRFGKLLDLTVAAGQPFATLRPAYRDVYFAQPELGGGAINDMITHFYNMGDWLAGPISRLVTDAAHQTLAGVSVEDTVHTLARHQGGTMATYAINLYQHPNECFVTAVCEGGTLRADYARCRWSRTGEDGVWTHEAVSVPHGDEMYRIQNAAFLDAVEGRGHVLCSLEDAVRTLRVNMASHRSVAESSWQQVLV